MITGKKLLLYHVRTMIAFIIWLLFLGIPDVEASFKDGTKIKFRGWLPALVVYILKRTDK